MFEIYKKFTTQKYEVHLKVEENFHGKRIDQFLSDFLTSFSRQQIKKKITNGDILIRNRPHPHKASTKIYEGEVVEVVTHRGNIEDEYWNGKKIEFQEDPDIIFEDEDIIAISKPPYMCTHPTGRHLFFCATVYFESRDDKTIHSIHRLDRETSGTLLLAKNPKAANFCTENFENGLVSKCYFLMAHKNKDTKKNFTANDRLGPKDGYEPRLFVFCFDENSNEGKSASTRFETVYENDDYILALAFPKTGRQHQIRSHAAFHGFPLIGDKLYNGDATVFQRFKDEIATKEDHDKMMLSRHALHALALKIPYPNHNETKVLRSKLPEDFKMWINENINDLNIKDLESKIDTTISNFF
ncbi:MAG: RluA family pseudouridine synthase [Bacteriovoracaceae bacterium]|jgi:RluA family pseudouridine synthase|nr:RluA family pseudouridine synthase [Bacteriovoracaceae bacterium]